MRLKKFIISSLSAVMIATSLVGCSMINKEKETEEPVSDLVNVTLLTDAEGGAGESLISSAREGLEEAESGLGIDGRFIKCSSKDDIKSNIEVLVKGGKTSLIIGAGPRFESIISVYAQKYPEQDFAIIDGTINGEIPKNLTTVTFDDERSGFIAGFIAGKMTAKNKVGYISGVSGSSEKAYKQGFEKGLKKANDKNPEIVSRNVNIYESYEDAKNAFVDVEYYGADILFSPTEDDSKAAIDSINSNYSKVIAVNKDQYHYSKDKVVASITKSYSKAVYDLCAMVYDGGESFKGGKNTQYGVAEKTIALSPSTENTVPPDVLSSLSKALKEEYSSGK